MANFFCLRLRIALNKLVKMNLQKRHGILGGKSHLERDRLNKLSLVGTIVKISVVLSVTLALYFADLTILFADALQSETLGYMLIIPFVLLFLVYRKRKMLRAVISLENGEVSRKARHLQLIGALLSMVTSILLYWYGSYTFTPLEYHMLSLPIFSAGLILLLFNIQTLRQLVFPILFLFFLTPPPSEILFSLGSTLSTVSSQVSTSLVGLFGMPLSLTSEYGNPLIAVTRSDGTSLQFSVDIACSGIYSLIAFFVFATLIAFIIRDKPWKRIALILIGIPIIYFFNIIRISSLLLLGYHYGETVALQAFHLLGGWVLIFFGTLLLLFVSEKVLRTKIFTYKAEICNDCGSNQKSTSDFCSKCGRLLKVEAMKIRKVDVFKMIAVILSVIFLISIQAPVFALAKSPGSLIEYSSEGEEVSTAILPLIAGYNLDFSYRDTEFEQLAGIDMALSYVYRSVEDPSEAIWVAVEIAPTVYNLHRWETCLIDYPVQHGQKPKVVQLELSDIELVENPHLIGRYFAFQQPASNLTQAVLYWYEKTTFLVNGTAEQKYVKISVIDYPESTASLAEAHDRLVALAKPIVDFWQPAKTWSLMSMALSANSNTLAALTSLFLLVVICLGLIEDKQKRKGDKVAYEKLSDSNKQIITVIGETGKKTLPTLRNILVTYKETSRRAITEHHLMENLLKLEKTGIVRSKIASNRDEPTRVWTTNVKK